MAKPSMTTALDDDDTLSLGSALSITGEVEFIEPVGDQFLVGWVDQATDVTYAAMYDASGTLIGNELVLQSGLMNEVRAAVSPDGTQAARCEGITQVPVSVPIVITPWVA